ncbi:MAG: carboxylating nicotinate-nucleotide diphosphorylase [Verrucomicrobia bacterium]|nr:MAG: carboxylating nicotinate-nucleotide diphosphorylase [Verrucomicrobiota bacterium]
MHEITRQLIQLALQEDIGSGDVTADFFVPAERQASAVIAARKSGVLSGVTIAAEVFRSVNPELRVEILARDGTAVDAGCQVMRIAGQARSILTAERTALNFLQHLSGIATMTSRYVEQIAHCPTRILDTRKTTPGYRLLEKQAVRDGGGSNHRMGLYDRAMVKDNHLVAQHQLPALQAAIDALKKSKPEVKIELEADHLEQVLDFYTLSGVDYILLDNMTLATMRRAVEARGNRSTPQLEASGGVTLETVAAIAETGVDFISVGALTHSAPALDLGLDFYPLEPTA